MSNQLKSFFWWMWILAVSFLATAPLFANEVKELSFDERMRASELVLIGEVTEVAACNDLASGRCRDNSVTAVVRVTGTLKGVATPDIRFRCAEAIVELSPMACSTGSRYLMFLVRDQQGVYHSVNGPYGVYVIREARTTFSGTSP